MATIHTDWKSAIKGYEDYLALDVENTWMGRNMEYLLNCLKGEVEPYHFVTYRIISKMADLV